MKRRKKWIRYVRGPVSGPRDVSGLECLSCEHLFQSGINIVYRCEMKPWSRNFMVPRGMCNKFLLATEWRPGTVGLANERMIGERT